MLMFVMEGSVVMFWFDWNMSEIWILWEWNKKIFVLVISFFCFVYWKKLRGYVYECVLFKVVGFYILLFVGLVYILWFYEEVVIYI